MERQQILHILQANRRQLKRDYAVETLALFGSVARGESTAHSDVDLLVEFSRPIGLLHVIQTEQYLESLLGVERVDLILRRAVLPELRDQILAEALDAL
jgi:predicted nucleotidyltransferase